MICNPYDMSADNKQSISKLNVHNQINGIFSTVLLFIIKTPYKQIRPY